MATWRDGIELRAKQYAQRYDRLIEDELGFGYDGIVFSTTCQSAIKALRYEPLYQRERDVMEAWRAEKREQFGADWPRVQDVMREFRSMGIFLADVKPGNITL
jgi:hypothetical protein